jgi:hypothetical protein
LQKLIVFVLLLSGIITSINQALRRKALISPPWDGFISGFGCLIGLIDLLYPNLSILRTTNTPLILMLTCVLDKC